MPTPMRTYVNGQAEVIVSGASVAEAIENLLVLFPAMRQHLTNDHGDLRPFVNLFLEGCNVSDLQGMDTPLAAEAILLLVPSVAGG
jgi:sulfur-carrier protein